MTGLSKYSHISKVRKVLKLLTIEDLNIYMKLSFVKNIKNSNICNNIFLYKLNNIKDYKPRSNCFIKEFKEICSFLNLEPLFVYENT
jgi:hypothetical protein